MELVLTGKFLKLRSLQVEDAEALAVAGTESREHYDFTVVPNGFAETRLFIADRRSQSNRVTFAIEWNGRVAGTTSFLNIETWTCL